MNEWLLQRLEREPDRIFYEWELRMQCREFDDLQNTGLLTRDLEAEESEFCFDRRGHRLHLERLDGVIFGVDADDPNDPFVDVDPEDLIRYRFNLGRWQRMIREANRLSGPASRLEHYLFFLGEKEDTDHTLGYVLGFFNHRDSAFNLLLGLPARIASKYDAIVVTTPISTLLPQTDIANLERLGVYVVPHLDSETLLIEQPRLSSRRGEIATVQLTAEEEEQSKRYGYKSGLPIVITGETAKWRRNRVLVNGFPVLLGDSLFPIFLRLVVRLLKSGDGVVTKAGLRSGGFVKSGSEDQTIDHLRKTCAVALGHLSPKLFIESCSRGSIRLSTHPALIRYDKDKLLRHRNEEIRRLATQLP